MSLYESGESTGAMCLSDLLSGNRPTSTATPLTVTDVADLVVRGGWPLNLGQAVRDAAQSNTDYLRTIADVDIIIQARDGAWGAFEVKLRAGQVDEAAQGRLAFPATGRHHQSTHQVLDGIDLDAEQGTVFALLGPNGSGKTTTDRILSTLTRADAGGEPEA